MWVHGQVGEAGWFALFSLSINADKDNEGQTMLQTAY
jgi:hypothetical protein